MSSFDPTPISFGGPAPDTDTITEQLALPVFETPEQLTFAVVETAEEVVTTVTFEATETIDPVDAREAEIQRLVANHTRTDLSTTEAFTEWRQLRDYVCSAIEAKIGSFPRNPVKEKAIFVSFFDRWGDKAEPIARRAVEVHDCWWNSSPLSVTRFCKGSDPYFSEVIAQQL